MSGLYDATEDRDANVFEINEVTNTHNRAADMAISRHMIILLFIYKWICGSGSGIEDVGFKKFHGVLLQYLGELRRKVRWIALEMDSGRIGFRLKVH
jgi:hypothetical protein